MTSVTETPAPPPVTETGMPLVRVVRGDPGAEEMAALLAVLLRRTSEAGESGPTATAGATEAAGTGTAGSPTDAPRWSRAVRTAAYLPPGSWHS